LRSQFQKGFAHKIIISEFVNLFLINRDHLSAVSVDLLQLFSRLAREFAVRAAITTMAVTTTAVATTAVST